MLIGSLLTARIFTLTCFKFSCLKPAFLKHSYPHRFDCAPVMRFQRPAPSDLYPLGLAEALPLDWLLLLPFANPSCWRSYCSRRWHRGRWRYSPSLLSKIVLTTNLRSLCVMFRPDHRSNQSMAYMAWRSIYSYPYEKTFNIFQHDGQGVRLFRCQVCLS